MGYLRAIAGIELRAVGDEAADLPAAGGVFVDEGIIKAEFLGDGLRGDLAFATDEELRSHAWMTVHVFTGIGSKVAGQVGETLLEWVHVAYFCLRAAKNLHDAVEDVSIDVLYEVGVERAQLVKGVEFVDGVCGVSAHGHGEFFDMVDIELLSQFVFCCRSIVFGFEDFDETLRECAIEIDVAQHIPCIRSAD